MKKRAAVIEVEKIDLDKENPRIKAALENPSIVDDASYDELRLQLEHAMSAGGGSRGWRRLRRSIKAAGRALQRITVVEVDDRYVCIDGNTRVAIYKDLQDKNEPGDWGYIEADIIMDSDPAEVEKTHRTGPDDQPHRGTKRLVALQTRKVSACFEIRREDELEGNRRAVRRGGKQKRDANQHGCIRVVWRSTGNRCRRTTSRKTATAHSKRWSRLRMVKTLEEHGKSMEDFNRWVEKGVLRTDAEVRDLRKVLNGR